MTRTSETRSEGNGGRAGAYPPEKLDLLVRSAGVLWDSTGGDDPHDVLSARQREALDLAAAAWRAELNRFPPEKLDLLVRSAGELWNSTGGDGLRHVLFAPQREALDLAAALHRAELDREMGTGDE
jgi:hypothetical protein